MYARGEVNITCDILVLIDIIADGKSLNFFENIL